MSVPFYDNHLVYQQIRASYVSPAKTLPLDQVEPYLVKQRSAYSQLTHEVMPGDMLTEEQFTESVKLSFDEAEAARRRELPSD